MRKKLISYANETMSKSLELCLNSGKKMGFDESFRLDPTMFEAGHEEDSFSYFNRSILQQPRGCGYWIWKPFIIFHYLLCAKENDIIVYSDAGVEWIENPNYIIDRMDQDLFIFGNMYQHSHWCKRDCFIKMNCDSEKYWISKQAQASVIFIRNTEYSRNFVKEWLLWCQMPSLIDDSPSVSENLPEFREHRHDQAILTNLAIRENIKLHYWPARYNNQFDYPKNNEYIADNYPIIFNHHRRRNEEF